jgi:large subunit ribosomal protein L23
MGLLSNWFHKQKKEQLIKTGEKKQAPVVVATPTPKGRGSDRSVGEEKKTEHKIKLSDKSLAFKILVKPLVTEKSAIAESKNKYSFVVVRSANKNQIKTAIEEIYGVKPANVNVANIEGRRVRFGRSMGKRNDYKKAIVTLPAGKSINIHTGV